MKKGKQCESAHCEMSSGISYHCHFWKRKAARNSKSVDNRTRGRVSDPLNYSLLHELSVLSPPHLLPLLSGLHVRFAW